MHNTSNNAGKKRNLIRGLCADIKDVSFSLESKIFGENFEVLPLGIGKNAYQMQDDILFCKEKGNANSTFNELVVMSPFLSESVIADFNLTDRALSDCKRTLITRRSELGKLKASDVDNFTIYALKDEIIDGEDEISDELADKKKQDIHAKIYLRRKYSDVDLYLGSMNASYSAINKNVEMMLWLGTKNMYLNGDKFLEDIFCGPAGDVKNPFEQVTVADAVLETESDNRNLLEQKIKKLCRVKRQAVISEDNENAGKYKITVEFSGIQSDSAITVSPFNSKQEQTLSEHIEFSELEILQLSEFYEITAKAGEDIIRRIIMIPTKLLSLTSENNADKLKRSVHITGRVKTENEKGYYIVDAINEAINAGVKISFYYSELNGKKKEVLRNDGKPYTVSPFDLIWDGDYYYLTGYCDEREAVRTYRVDRIKKQPEMLPEKAVEKPKGYNVSKYTTEVFRMFSTDEAIDVTLLCDNCIMKSVVDKFGMKIKTQSVGEEKFRIKVKVCVSPTFYRWVFGAAGKIMIEGPSNVRKAYKEMLQKSLDSMN